jgi:hypothetical protein
LAAAGETGAAAEVRFEPSPLGTAALPSDAPGSTDSDSSTSSSSFRLRWPLSDTSARSGRRGVSAPRLVADIGETLGAGYSHSPECSGATAISDPTPDLNCPTCAAVWRGALWAYRRLEFDISGAGLALSAGALSAGALSWRAAVEGRCENKVSALAGEASVCRCAARAFASRRASLCAYAPHAREQQHTNVGLPWDTLEC